MTNFITVKSNFKIGMLVYSPEVQKLMQTNISFANELNEKLQQYSKAEWENWDGMSLSRNELNRQILKEGNDRILARYQSPFGYVYITTDEYNKTTTILFHDEYEFMINGNCLPTPINQPLKNSEDTDSVKVNISLKKQPVSNYNKKGNRKATPSDPIRLQEDIVRLKIYFRTNGRTPQLRLRNYTLFILGISIGLRGSDLINLKISDVLDSEGRIVDIIRVNESKTRKSIYPYLNETAKSAISEYLCALKSYSVDDPLFGRFGNLKESITPKHLYEIMASAQQALNLPYHLGAHSLRKTFAYWTIKLHPNDLKTMISLQEMLNHSSPQTTLHYAGQTRDVLQGMYNDLNKVLDDNPVVIDNPLATNKIDLLYDLISRALSVEAE